MKIRKIILIMLVSLLLPLAGAFARVAQHPDATDIRFGGLADLMGQAADEQAMEPTRRHKKKSSKESKSKKSSKKSP